MENIKKSEASTSPVLSHHDTSNQSIHGQASHNGSSCHSLTRSCNEAVHVLSTRSSFDLHNSAVDSTPHKHENKAAPRAWPHDPGDDHSSFKAKMWDPVKDCEDPSSTQDEVPRSLLDCHNTSDSLMHSAVSEFISTGLHSCHSNHLYDQARSRRQQYGFENASTLHPHLREPSWHDGQRSMESTTRRAALTGLQPRQAGNVHDDSPANRQQFTGMEPRLPTPMTPHESARLWQSLPPTTSYPSTQASTDSQQHDRLHRPSLSADMLQAWKVVQHAQKLEQDSDRTEAVRAYEQACALFQEAVINGSSLEERVECNNARNMCQARLDVLLRESEASASNAPPGQDDQEDDGPGGGKPQYSLYEDWALCCKQLEDLSWQEVAQTPMFNGRRKHRSLSQRKHTISRMGPKFYEPELPWTEDEDRKLCILGDSGKTLGDIHRKFRSRNAERCLNRYFFLKGYQTTGRSRTQTSRQARHTAALHPLGSQNTSRSSLIERHPAYRLHSTNVDQNASFALPLRGQASSSQCPSPRFSSIESPILNTITISPNNASPTNSFTTRVQSSPHPSRRQSQASSPSIMPSSSSPSAYNTSSPINSPSSTSPPGSPAPRYSPFEKHTFPESQNARRSWQTSFTDFKKV